MSHETIIMRSEPEPVASYRHSLFFLGIAVAIVIAGYAVQHRPTSGGSLVEGQVRLIPIYISVAVLDWLLFLFAWYGVHRRGGKLRSLIGGRWSNGSQILRDIAIAALAWGVILLASWAIDGTLGHGHQKSLNNLLPQTFLEVGVWFLVSVTGGFCEEFVFRGYVQSQFMALSRRTWIAILGQGCIFGLFHSYQGWRSVVTITVIGVLFGILATWRKTLKVGMIVHGWQDFWGGWLVYALFS
jgi:membrane protease YdiL (CAAX protease family)